VPDEEPRPLRAVPAPPGGQIEPGPAIYADVTDPGALRPVLPYWLKSWDTFRAVTRRRAGYEMHRAAVHSIRLPWYLVLTVFWGVAGTIWLFLLWLRWWLSPVPAAAQVQAAGQGWREWKALHLVHRRTAKVRAWISAGVIIALVTAAETAPRWVLYAAGAAALIAAAVLGRPEGVRIITPARVPSQYEPLTQDVVTRALGSLGNAKIDRWLREGRQIAFTGPVRQDGPGWRAECDLPYGATAVDVIEKRAEFASGLRRPLGAVWPEGVSTEHPGRLEVWVGQQDISKAKAPPWPLLKSGQADVFKGVPFAVDVRGRKVTAPIAYHAWLIGSIPRQGKTATVRVLALAVSLDPLPQEWVHELKGTGDLDALEPLCTRFVSGITDDAMAYTAQSLAMLRAECEQRGPLIKGLPTEICPEKRVTREICQKYPKLRPVVCVIDECQNLFKSQHGKQAKDDADFVVKVGPAMGIWLILATQRPDKDSLPTGVSANVSSRFCLKVMGQLENDMILGTSMYKNGVRATTFRSMVDAGTGYLISEAPDPQVCRAYFLDVRDAKVVVARARVLRERAGTLPVQADAEGPERDVLADVLAVVGAEPGAHWETIAERLSDRWPDRWAGVSKDAVSTEVQGLGVPSVTVTVAGQRARGCRKEAIEAAMQRALPPRSAACR
jgi:S-DNA-T family DNA segregation ATPase FtsK/SpoIIIE